MTASAGDTPHLVPYSVARKLLAKKFQATTEEIAAWLYDGWPDNEKDTLDGSAPAHVLRAYVCKPRAGATPPWFAFPTATSKGHSLDLGAAMVGCYFNADELHSFTPEARYVTGLALVDKLVELTGGQEAAEVLIQRHVNHGRLTCFHPMTGLTRWDEENWPGMAPRDAALFSCSQVDPILEELEGRGDSIPEASVQAIGITTATSQKQEASPATSEPPTPKVGEDVAPEKHLTSMKRGEIINRLGRRYPKLGGAINRNTPWTIKCRVPGHRLYFLELIEAGCIRAWGGTTIMPSS
jgi:hypothetical protein